VRWGAFGKLTSSKLVRGRKTHGRRRERPFESGDYEEGMTESAALSAPPSESTALLAHRARSETSSNFRASRTERYRLDHLPDDALHTGVKTLVGRHNVITADLLAHLAEVEARGIYRERACSSLYTYCIHELRLSEDEAQRRAKAARTAREFPILFELLAEGAIHMTGLLLLAPCLTPSNHAELLARARFRTKREIERLVAEVAPRPDVPSRIEPLGPRSPKVTNLWQAYAASLRGPVRDVSPGVGPKQAPAAVFELADHDELAEPSEREHGSGPFESPASAGRRARFASHLGDDRPASLPRRVHGKPRVRGSVGRSRSTYETGEVFAVMVPADQDPHCWYAIGERDAPPDCL
jgi:hypothetical protein